MPLGDIIHMTATIGHRGPDDEGFFTLKTIHFDITGE